MRLYSRYNRAYWGKGTECMVCTGRLYQLSPNVRWTRYSLTSLIATRVESGSFDSCAYELRLSQSL